MPAPSRFSKEQLLALLKAKREREAATSNVPKANASAKDVTAAEQQAFVSKSALASFGENRPKKGTVEVSFVIHIERF